MHRPGLGSVDRSASGDAFGGGVLCDGSHVNSLTDPRRRVHAPWKSGAAAAGATVSVTDATFQSSHYASTGAVTVKLGK